MDSMCSSVAGSLVDRPSSYLRMEISDKRTKALSSILMMLMAFLAPFGAPST
jgi:hypothetical protein